MPAAGELEGGAQWSGQLRLGRRRPHRGGRRARAERRTGNALCVRARLEPQRLRQGPATAYACAWSGPAPRACTALAPAARGPPSRTERPLLRAPAAHPAWARLPRAVRRASARLAAQRCRPAPAPHLRARSAPAAAAHAAPPLPALAPTAA
ncbi:hypothetical protein PAHAL_1G205600 [Panicum hallii]|uniref:Uncharacterized protein n=1 Tax=Panicum hallii TaxID=206008 RepID=A0A2T8KVW2_9POAL|nr:hypothetical protein PAHAL_1G205600 [Panicum hallii]